TPAEMTSKRDHERDAELDKKIEALRRKNEALMKRYKEVEEDKKRAEEEGMALQSRKGKADDLTITISKSTSDSRVVVTKPTGVSSTTAEGQQEAGSDRAKGEPCYTGDANLPLQGKRVVSEKPEKKPVSADIKCPTDDGQAKSVESPGRGKQPPHVKKNRRNVVRGEGRMGGGGGPPGSPGMKVSSPEHQHSYKSDLISSLSDLATMACDHPLASSLEAEKLKSTNWHVWGGRRTRPVGTCIPRRMASRARVENTGTYAGKTIKTSKTMKPNWSKDPASPQASTDLNIPTSKEEQEEYIRWKKEREQIDRERVARHKNAKGQWRRAWDMDKTENM
uniref:Coiled-coil domain containing 9B n=1 Tax=Tetraodon nigroviridis TaxID=99883 RepID=H3DJB1_TETNG